jgi:low temperature requirement protein LtrA
VQPKKVTPVELFYDLVFVFAIVQVAGLLHHDPTWSGVGHAVVLFVPLFWAWAAMSTYTNLKGASTSLERLGHFGAGLCALVMAAAVPEAYGPRGLLFGAAFLAQRAVVTVLQQLRRTPDDPSLTFMVLFQISGPIMLVGALLDGNWRIGVWTFAVVLDLVMPRLIRAELSGMTFDLEHLLERYSLFLLIALGESILAIGSTVVALPRLTWPVVGALSSGFALVCGLWWLYFHFADTTAIPTRPLRTDQIGRLVGFSHLGFTAGVLGVAVGLSEAISRPESPLPGNIAALLLGGTAVFLATFAYSLWRMRRRLPWLRLIATAVVLGLLYVADRISAGLALLSVSVLLAVLNLVEYLVYRRSERGDQDRTTPDAALASTAAP